jgi:hypothetical protein
MCCQLFGASVFEHIAFSQSLYSGGTRVYPTKNRLNDREMPFHHSYAYPIPFLQELDAMFELVDAQLRSGAADED